MKAPPPHVQYYFGRYYHDAKKRQKESNITFITFLVKTSHHSMVKHITIFVIFTNIHLVLLSESLKRFGKAQREHETSQLPLGRVATSKFYLNHLN
jgi:hypothetical protein